MRVTTKHVTTQRLAKFQFQIQMQRSNSSIELTYMKLFSCAWFPSSNTAIIKIHSTLFSASQQIYERESENESESVPSEASTSMEGTLGGMSKRRNLQIAKANARTSKGHQNAIATQQIQSASCQGFEEASGEFIQDDGGRGRRNLRKLCGDYFTLHNNVDTSYYRPREKETEKYKN